MGDRISNLPNDVICHILSFLPTKDAVATSILSKQWKLQWRSVPVFDFECHCEPSEIRRKKGDNHKLLDSINAYLNSRDPLQSFQRLRLGCFPFEFHTQICHPTNVNQLISNVVVQHRLEHLDVSLPFKLDLPSVVLSCKTLVVLKLRSSTLRSSSIDLPLLKIMHLESVFLSEYKLLADLVSGCPDLEEIEVHHVRIHDYNLGVKPNFKKMHKLVRAAVDYYIFPLQVLSNVRFLRIDAMDNIPGCVIKFPIAQFHNLTHIEFGFEEYIFSEELDDFLVLKDSPKLQCLFIDQKTDDEFDDEEPDESEESSRRCPLRLPSCISQLKSFYINNYKDRLMEFEFSKYIMLNARQLKKMYVRTFRGTSEQKKLQIREKLSVFSSTGKLLVI